MKYFTIKELCKSSTADRLKIKNEPTDEINHHLELLIDCLLDPIREAWGSPIIVTSGYRSAALNKAVGGSKTSVHNLGWAADIIPANGKMEEFKIFISEFIVTRIWDQCILEKDDDKEWVHIGLYNNSGKQRRQLFSLDV